MLKSIGPIYGSVDDCFEPGAYLTPATTPGLPLGANDGVIIVRTFPEYTGESPYLSMQLFIDLFTLNHYVRGYRDEAWIEWKMLMKEDVRRWPSL